MSHRLINIFFFFVLTYIFVLFCGEEDHIRLLWAFSFAVSFSLVALLLNWLTLDGSLSAVLLGTIAFGLGSVTGAVVILSFFITSSLISQDINENAGDQKMARKRFRRDGYQVWANGFWFTLFIMIWFVSKEDIFLFASVGSIATATADTWATELGGNFKPGKTFLITTFEPTEPGTNGGISIKGLMAALAGAALIGAVLFWVSPGFSWLIIIPISIAGFLGSIIDSYLGATIQGRSFHMEKVKAEYKFVIDNNMVNWLSSGAGALLTMILIQFI